MGVGEAVNNAKTFEKLLLSWHLFQVKTMITKARNQSLASVVLRV